MPDGVLVSFPDEMPKEEIKELIASKFPNETGANQPDDNINKFEGALRSYTQGNTFGFGDEVVAGVSAPVASLFTGNSVSDSYNQILADERNRTKQFRNEEPIISGVSEIGGAIGTGLTGAATKTGAAIANTLRTGNTAARVGKGVLAGASSGGLYGYGSGEGQERLKSAGQGAIFGGATGGLVPAIGAAASRLNKRVIVPNADQIRAKAGDFYRLAEQKGGILKAEFTNKFVDDIEKLKPQTDIGQIIGGDTPFSKVVEKISTIRNRPMTLDAAQELDELLGDVVDDFTEMGRLTKQGKKLFDIQTTLRNMIDKADETVLEGGKEGFKAWKEGKKLWATSHRLSDIERIIQRAEMTDNPATSIKSGFRTLYSNPNRMKGFSMDEAKAIKKAAESGVTSDLLRTAGSRLIPIVSATTGGLGAGTAGAATAMAARNSATRMQLGKANDVARMIAEKSGMVQTQPRLSIQEIMKLPPPQARELLKQIPTATSKTQSTK